MGSKFHSLLTPADVEESALSGKMVAIDATAWLHQFLKVNTCSSTEQGRLALVDKTQRVINHLRGFLYRTEHLLRLGIWPIFVFDGVGTEKIRNAASKTDLFVAHTQLARMQVKARNSTIEGWKQHDRIHLFLKSNDRN
jgi:hypothetical protein